jgi:2-methylcitrate dehydratase PrpD
MTAMDQIMHEHGFKAADISQITAYVSNNTLHHCGWPYEAGRIQSVLSAQMNLRYGIAVMALERENGVAQFAESKIRDPEILKFISHIQVEHEPKFEGDNGRYRVACRLVVQLKDGNEHETTVLYRKGSPEDPMIHAQLMEKFGTLTKAFGRQRSEQIAGIVSHIDNCDDLTELSSLLTVAG